MNLQKENQDLKDEINRLKGEQGKPDVKPNHHNSKENKDVSSENERKQGQRKKNRKPKRKKNLLIHVQKTCEIDQSSLPADAVFKGYAKKIYQGIKIELNNILIKREIYYSPAENKTYVAKLPPGYDGTTYTPELKAALVDLKFKCGMTEPKILKFLTDRGLQISAGTISNILIRVGKDIFLNEKNDIFATSLESTPYQQTDTTGTRENGVNRNSHIFCNELYSAFFTRDRQDRSTILDILRKEKPRVYRLNQEALELFEILRIPIKHRAPFIALQSEGELDTAEIETLIAKQGPQISATSKHKILDAAYLAGYHAQTHIPILLTDDAPQYKLIPDRSGLCWIHDGRHYKKLNPVVARHRKKLVATKFSRELLCCSPCTRLEKFRKRYWSYYKLLLKYKSKPSIEQKEILIKKFNKLFETITGYDELDKRISKTKSKMNKLLLVLDFSFLPLHNNASELGARAIVRQRDISLQTKCRDGTDTRDAYLTIIYTAKKLGVNVYSYLLDRIYKRNDLPSLASLIRIAGKLNRH